MSDKVRIGLVGLGFGVNFLPVYLRHPDVAHVGLCDISESRLHEVGREYGITRLYDDLDKMIASGEFDAIHLMTQLPYHATQTVRVLDAGLHCACAVPMGISLDELADITAAVKCNRRRYMLMEPNAFWPETLHLQNLYRSGELGRIQFMRGLQSYFLNNHPHPFWRGLPPMHYISHALAPLLVIADTRTIAVQCLGSGWMREELCRVHGNPFPIETALFELALPGVIAEVTIHFFETAVAQREGFDIYGEKISFKWREFPGEKHALVRLVDSSGFCRDEMAQERVDVPHARGTLPEELETFCREEPDSRRAALCELVHEFVRSIVEEREPALGVKRAFDITIAGLTAHASALRHGARIVVPSAVT